MLRRAIGVSFSSLPTARRLAPVLLCLLPAFAAGDTVLVLDGFEGALGSWGNTQLVEQPVHTGKRALKWSVADRPLLDSPRFVADWSDFDELRFWAYCDRPVDFSIPLVFMSEGGYYLADWKLGWEGWKEQRIKLADCKPAHQPAGWQEISGVGFRAQGYVRYLDTYCTRSAPQLRRVVLRKERVFPPGGNPWTVPRNSAGELGERGRSLTSWS